MVGLWEAESVSIASSEQSVYRFASNPENLPLWASGVSNSIRRVGENWFSESPMGDIKIEFTPQNENGVLDHIVTFPDGQAFYNPMRVFPNADGCEVVFTLFRRPATSDTDFQTDVSTVKKDLSALKILLESRASEEKYAKGESP